MNQYPLVSRREASTRLARRWLPLLVALALAGAANVSVAQAPCAPAPGPAGAVVAQFTGRFESGAPVYRLPALTVTAARNLAVVEGTAVKRNAPLRPGRRQAS